MQGATCIFINNLNRGQIKARERYRYRYRYRYYYRYRSFRFRYAMSCRGRAAMESRRKTKRKLANRPPTKLLKLAKSTIKNS